MTYDPVVTRSRITSLKSAYSQTSIWPKNLFLVMILKESVHEHFHLHTDKYLPFFFWFCLVNHYFDRGVVVTPQQLHTKKNFFFMILTVSVALLPWLAYLLKKLFFTNRFYIFISIFFKKFIILNRDATNTDLAEYSATFPAEYRILGQINIWPNASLQYASW